MVGKSDGFSLLECVIYLALFAICTTVMSSFVVRVIQGALAASRRCEDAQLVWSISRLLARDFEQASDKVSDWGLASDHCVSCRAPEQVQWYVLGKTLWRQEGNAKIKVAGGMLLANCALDVAQTRVRGVHFTISQGAARCVCYVPLLRSIEMRSIGIWSATIRRR